MGGGGCKESEREGRGGGKRKRGVGGREGNEEGAGEGQNTRLVGFWPS